VKVLMLHPGMGFRHSRVFPPLGAMGIARYLAENGCEVRVADLTAAPIDDAVTRLLDAEVPDIVGLTVLIGDVAKRALEASQVIRRISPRTRIAWGGPLVSTDPAWAASLPCVDAAFRGDGERQLLDWLRDGAPRRLSVSEAVQEPRVEQAFAGLHDLQRQYILPAKWSPELRIDSVFVASSRGCPGQCPFCYLRTHSPGRIRTSPEAVLVDQLTRVAEWLSVRGFYFLDDAFTGDRARTRAFCEELIRRDCNFRWFCDTRIEDLVPDALPLLWMAGARSFYIGVESGSERIRRLLKKTMPICALKDRLSLILRMGFSAKLSIVVGWPEEDRTDMDQSLELADTFPEAQLDVYRFCPLPGTPLGEQILRAMSTADRANVRFWNWESLPRNFSNAPDEHVDMVQNALIARKNERLRRAIGEIRQAAGPQSRMR